VLVEVVSLRKRRSKMHRDPHHLNVRFSFQGPSGRSCFRCGGEESRRPTSECQPIIFFFFEELSGVPMRGPTGVGGATCDFGPGSSCRFLPNLAAIFEGNRARSAHLPHRVSTRWRDARRRRKRVRKGLLGLTGWCDEKSSDDLELDGAGRGRFVGSLGGGSGAGSLLRLPRLRGKLWTFLAGRDGVPRDAPECDGPRSRLRRLCLARREAGLKPETRRRQAKVANPPSSRGFPVICSTHDGGAGRALELDECASVRRSS